MPSFATTQTQIDTRLDGRWTFDPTKRWGIVERFHQTIFPPALWGYTPGGNATADLQAAARFVAQLATAASPLWALTGRNAANQYAEACGGSATGGLLLSTITTGAAQNDSTAIRPLTAFTGPVVTAAPSTNLQFNSDLSPEFGLVFTHTTADAGGNDSAFHFQAGMRTSSGWDPTAANYDETNNAGADGAFFSTSSTFTLQFVTRIGSVSTIVDSGISMLNQTTFLGIALDAARVPVFTIRNASGSTTWSGAAITAAKQLLPGVSIKTTDAAGARKVIKLRGLRATKLLA